MSSTEARLQALARIRADFTLYSERCLKIRTKSGEIRPLAFNAAQVYAHQKLEEQRKRTGKVRALILKARQQGFSTYIGGRYYHRASLNRGLQALILAHEQKASETLFQIVDRFHRLSPVSPIASRSSVKELQFGRLDSGYAVETAGAKAAGRSKTVQLLHGSEVAFWENAQGHFAGVVQTVPDLPGTEIVLETTGNGPRGEFYDRWQDAEAGIGDYQAIFVPWFWTEEYRREPDAEFMLTDEEREYARLHGLDAGQIAWRRAKLAEMKDPALFMQEYPATATEAFQATGSESFIPSALVLKARKAKLEAAGPLIVGVDPKREGTDRFSIARRRGRVVPSVESDARPVDTLTAAGKLKTILDAENPLMVFVDVGGNGGAICDILRSWGYGKRVREVNFGAAPIEPKRLMSDGSWRPGPRNRRAEMWEASRDWLAEAGGAQVPDSDSLQADACAPGYSYDTQQRLVLESKEHLAARGIRSPDEWDAIALTFAEPVVESTPASAEEEFVGGSTGWMA